MSMFEVLHPLGVVLAITLIGAMAGTGLAWWDFLRGGDDA